MSLTRQRGNFSMLPRFLKRGTITSSVSWQKCSANNILVVSSNVPKTVLKTYQGRLDRCRQGWARWEAAHLPLSVRDQIPVESKVPWRRLKKNEFAHFCQTFLTFSLFTKYTALFLRTHGQSVRICKNVFSSTDEQGFLKRMDLLPKI